MPSTASRDFWSCSLRDVFRKQNKKSKDIERWLANKVENKKADWWRKSVNKESQLMRNVDLLGKFIHEESWLTRIVDLWGKLINKESWSMRIVHLWGK